LFAVNKIGRIFFQFKPLQKTVDPWNGANSLPADFSYKIKVCWNYDCMHIGRQKNHTWRLGMSASIKWGILGFARIAKTSVIPAIIKSENSQLYAVASGDPDKRKECKDLFDCSVIYSGYDQLLDDPDV
jgi:hypothetical protein